MITHVCNHLLFYKYLLLTFTCYLYEVTIGCTYLYKKVQLEVCCGVPIICTCESRQLRHVMYICIFVNYVYMYMQNEAKCGIHVIGMCDSHKHQCVRNMHI